MLLILRLVGHFDHLAAAITAAVLANVMRTHQLATLLAGHQCRRGQPLVLTPVASAMARNFCFWNGTHNK
jgi:hypothetical protein